VPEQSELKSGGCYVLITVLLGPRPTSIPSGIVIHPTVWPQYTNVTDRRDRTGQTDKGPIA